MIEIPLAKPITKKVESAKAPQAIPEARALQKQVDNKVDAQGFFGLNRMPFAKPGELKDMTNLSSRYAPCLYPRDPRSVHATLADGQALFVANSKLCWVDGTNFIYEGSVKGAVAAGPKSVAEYFGIILIMPDKKYYNYATNTFGNIATAQDMDYICVHNNRAFGVKGNNFYASKSGDPLTWNQFSVPLSEADSFQTNTAEEGDFTGIIVIDDTVVAFKKKYCYELLGSKPSNFKLQRIAKKGCTDFKSISEINGTALFMGKDGVYQYTGGTPRNISYNLDEKYVSCVAGSDERRYYASIYNGTAYNLYVYDAVAGLWHREDNLQVKDFALLDGYLYALAADNNIYKFNSGAEVVSWECEFDKMTEQYFGRTVTTKIKVIADIEAGASLSISYKINDGNYVLSDTFTDTGEQAFVSTIKPMRANSLQIKISGTGKAKVYSLGREISYSSDVPVE
jgi:hypothetical protein